ncbi:MAG: CYTH domain-containing protein [Saccharofermentans sp.]|nr:CYTH domain-containing protein [Saccharofermentans sp.]
METEVKLAFKDRESLFSAASSDWFKSHCVSTDSEPLTLENCYLDTADGLLRSRGAVFRKRHFTGGGTDSYEFTAKCVVAVTAGVHERYEWNVKSEDGAIDIEGFKAKAMKQVDDPKVLERLLEGVSDGDIGVLCSNDFERTTYEFRYGESLMEACIDYGGIKDLTGKICDIICEMELELMEGSLEDLEAAKSFIMSRTDAVPFDTGKFERTLRASVSGGAV